jgi:hypothetical protein
MRRRKVLRWLCSARLSGNSYLVLGALVAVLAPFTLVGAPLAPLILAIAVALALILAVSLVGVLLAPVVL